MGKNQKKIWWIIAGIILLLVVIIFIAMSFKYNQKIEEKQDLEQQLDDIEIIGDEIDGDSVQAKINILKKRLELKWLIQWGDLHFQNEEYTRALSKYLQAIKQSPDDESIKNKIWNIYFKLHKYDQAYKYYSQIKTYSQLDIHRALRSLFYSVELDGNKTIFVLEELNSYNLSEDEKFYYKTSIECTKSFVTCKDNFSAYFDALNGIQDDENQDNSEETGTWNIQEHKVVFFPELENIRIALKNYENFQFSDLSYQSALISGAFYQNRLYPVAITTATNTLKISPDYRPLIKIIARSNYEIWNYIESKKFLIQYNNLWDNEPEVSYFLWIVHQKLREYTRSTIQMRKAESLGYENIIDIKRRLIYNYYQLWDHKKMLKIFDELMEENIENITSDDVSLAIFYNILYDNYDVAEKYTQKSLELFPENEVFLWYKSWLALQKEEINEEMIVQIEKDLQKAIELNGNNPMISLTFGQLEEIKEDTQKAFIYYKKTISLDPSWEYAKLAEKNIQELNLENNQ